MKFMSVLEWQEMQSYPEFVSKSKDFPLSSFSISIKLCSVEPQAINHHNHKRKAAACV
jgi:hypothetical protein